MEKHYDNKMLHPKDYEILSGQCEIFAKELLDQARSSEELSTILYYSDESDAISQDGILGKLLNHDSTVHSSPRILGSYSEF